MDALQIETCFSQYDFRLTPDEAELFAQLLSAFLAKNQQINLSAVRDEMGVVEKHFIDSCVLSASLPLQGKILDLGTWWGFPGLPLAICHPNLHFTLLDSTAKKIRAVTEFASQLDLANVQTVAARAEEISSLPPYAHQFDCVVSRAVAYLPQVLEWALPFVKKDGKILLLKTPSDEEVADGKKYMAKKWLTMQIIPYELAQSRRCILEITFLN